MSDDHGTLRDAADRPIAYRVCEWPLPNIPLSVSQIWPEDMLMVSAIRERRVVRVSPKPGQRCDADRFAEDIERRTSRRLGLVPCSGNHDGLRCSTCGATR